MNIPFLKKYVKNFYFQFTLNDYDLEGRPLTVSEVTNSSHGQVVINADNTVSYTPYENYFGEDSFTYTVTDGNGCVQSATVSIVNNPGTLVVTPSITDENCNDDNGSIDLAVTGGANPITFAWVNLRARFLAIDVRGSGQLPEQPVYLLCGIAGWQDRRSVATEHKLNSRGIEFRR